MTKSPWISIIIPTLNAEKKLQTALSSIINQEYQRWDVMVVDGCSDDDTIKIVRSNSSKQISWLSEPDSGLYDAMNKGAGRVKGDWVYFLGADDILINCLHKIAPYLRNRQTIYYGDVFLPGKNKTYDGKFRWHRLVSKNINHQSIFYPRGVFEYYAYDLKYPIWADYDLNLRCWGDGHYKFKYLPVLVAVHGDRGISNQKIDEAFQTDKPDLVRYYFGRRIALRTIWLNVRARLWSLRRFIGLK
jgi:glycosyltransferase involved in cell wall biosynthesis